MVPTTSTTATLRPSATGPTTSSPEEVSAPGAPPRAQVGPSSSGAAARAASDEHSRDQVCGPTPSGSVSATSTSTGPSVPRTVATATAVPDGTASSVVGSPADGQTASPSWTGRSTTEPGRLVLSRSDTGPSS